MKRILGRIDGIKKGLQSYYWEYARYHKDNMVWEKTIFFESFGGLNFQGNPFYIYKEIYKDEIYKDYRLIIAHKEPAQLEMFLRQQRLFDDRVSIVKKDSAAYRNTLSHSKYLVNNVSFNMDFIKKEQQVYLNTWHGTPLKCLGRNIQNDPFECNNAQRNFLLCDYLIAPNELTKKVFEEDYMVRGIMPGEIILKGYPRNSIFFDVKARELVRQKYNLEDVFSVFYMPTWRGNASSVEDVDQVSEVEELAKELGEGYRVYVKFHPAMKKDNTSFKYCYEMPDDIEVYEFLNAIDILITDYSSVFFDFANTEKNIILYQYDKEDYFKKRGIYKEVEQHLSFPVIYTYQELLKTIKLNVKKDYNEFNRQFCAFDSLDVAKDVVKLLLEDKKVVNNGTSVDLYVIDFPVTDEWILRLKENLTNTNSRLVFIPKRSNGRFANLSCFEKIDYCVLYPYDRLTLIEKVENVLGRVIYCLCKSQRALNVLHKYGSRERKRLWGDLNVGNVYAKTRQVPTAIYSMVEKWPEYL